LKKLFEKIAPLSGPQYVQLERTYHEFSEPCFHPGPTNMPEAIRQACYMPTIDHRSPLFGKIPPGAGRRASGSEI
jgi:hypothetical protein